MFDTLKKFVMGDEHDELLSQLEALRAEFAKHVAARESRIEVLETRRITSVREFDQTRAEIEREKRDGDKEKTDFQIREGLLLAKIGRVADSRIDGALRRLWLEREATARALSVRGTTTQNAAGGLNGFVDTNRPNIAARISAIDAALKELEGLKMRRVDSVSAEIKIIERQIPPLNPDVERFESSPAVAQDLNYER